MVITTTITTYNNINNNDDDNKAPKKAKEKAKHEEREGIILIYINVYNINSTPFLHGERESEARFLQLAFSQERARVDGGSKRSALPARQAAVMASLYI